MNIPDSVRETLHLALDYILKDEFSDPRGHLPEEMVYLYRAQDWLNAQPATPEPNWQPVDYFPPIRCYNEENELKDYFVTLGVYPGYLSMSIIQRAEHIWNIPPVHLTAKLPDGYAFCKLVEEK